ncbi:phosphotransferase enzyme family protein [Methylobacter luteus]|uniref:phosphotransferase enzyme family protein n=1 Tax=Methylobacter luteus TaxID=415 RepID=UPI0004252DCC|nr:phosphotransferase [Methylobacter luteus]
MISDDIGIIEHVGKNYFNSNILSCKRCERGVAARNYKVHLASGLTALVRIDEQRSARGIACDDLLMNEASLQGVGTPVGHQSWTFTGGITVSVRPWIEGTAQADIGAVFGERLHELGRTLARIHKTTLQAMPPNGRQFFYMPIYNRSASSWELIVQAPEVLNDHPEALEIVNVAIQIVTLRANSNLPFSPVGLAHGDFSPSNLIVNKGEIFVIDWEKSCFGPLYSDIAQAIYYFLTAFGNCNDTNITRFLLGYRSEREIEDYGALEEWLYLHPVHIFLHDTARTISKRKQGQLDHFAYFLMESLPRIKKHFELYK